MTKACPHHYTPAVSSAHLSFNTVKYDDALMMSCRMVYSFARSGGIPCSAFFANVNPRTHTPLRAVWLLTLLAFLLGLPLLKSVAAFGAVTSMANIALLISYAIPIACRHTFSRNSFEAGPFQLGAWSEVIGWSGVAWTALSSVSALVVHVYSSIPFMSKGIMMPLLCSQCLLQTGWYTVQVKAQGPRQECEICLEPSC